MKLAFVNRLCSKVGFILGFPLGMFLLIAIIDASMLSFLTDCVWLIVVLVCLKNNSTPDA